MAKEPETIHAAGAGVFAVLRDHDKQCVRVEHRQVPALCAEVGNDVVVALIGALNAAERLYALADLTAELPDEHEMSRLRRERNLHALHFLTLSALHEGLDAIERMRGAGIERKLGPSCSPWLTLEKIRKRWRRNPMLKNLRNAFGAHLGLDEIAAGVEKIRHGNTVVFFERDGDNGLLNARHPIVLQTLLLGADIEQSDFERDVTQAMLDAPEFAVSVNNVMAELLRSTGANLPTAE